MLLKCFKLFYIKDNSVENSVDFNKKKKKMDPPLLLLLCVIVCDLTFRGREDREKTIILPNVLEKKMK